MRLKLLLQNIFRFKGALLLAFVISCGGLAIVHPVFAQTPPAAPPTVPVPAPAPSTASAVATAAGDVVNYGIEGLLSILTTLLNYIAAAIVKLTLVVMEMLIIPILNYNSFSSSPIIGLGWSLVRDVMNMFVIIALLFIAIFTIVGNHRAHWEQQLPQLFLAVIFMNFSRTICGILIDISQVIMFTFVNALLDIAAGNFAQLMGLQDFGKYNTADIEAGIESGDGTGTASQFVAAFLQIPLYGAIFAILFLLALAFLYRIVILWVLVILSPAAFLLGGLKGVFGQAAGDHAQWWGKFTGALLMGPILTFFLWLSLAAASSGSISSSEKFPVPVNTQSYGLSLEVFDSSHLTGLLLALILLVVGMQIAGEQSQKVGGLAETMISKGMGEKVVGGALRAPFQVGAAAGRKADIYGAQLYGGKTIRETLGTGVIKAGERVAKAGEGTVFQGVTLSAGRALAGAGGVVELQGEHLRAEREKAAKERIGKMSDTEKAANLGMLSMGKESRVVSTQEDFNALALDAMSDRVQDETKEHIKHAVEKKNPKVAGETAAQTAAREAKIDKETDTAFNDTMRNVLSVGNAEKKKGKLDDAAKGKLNSLNTKYADLLDDPAKWVQDDKFNMTDARKRPEVLDNATVREALKKKVGTRKDRDGNFMTVWDEVEKGLHGDKLQTAAAKYAAAPTPAPRPREETAASVTAALNTSRNTRADLEGTLKSKYDAVDIVGGTRAPETGTGPVESVQPILQPADLTGDRAADIGGAIVNSKVDISTSPIKSEIVQNIVNTQPAENITAAIKNNQVQPTDIPASAFAAANTNRTAVVESVINNNVVSQMSMPTRDAFKASVEQMQSTGGISEENYTAAKTALLQGEHHAAGRPLESVISGTIMRDPATGLASVLDDQAENELKAIFEQKGGEVNYKYVEHEMPTAPNVKTEVTKVVAQTADTRRLESLATAWGKAVGQQKTDLKAAMDVIHESLKRETTGVPRPRGGKTPAELRDMLDESTKIRSRLNF